MNNSYCMVETCPSNQLPTTTITTMAAAGGNGPLAPHTRPFILCQCVRLVEDNPLSKRMHFLPGLGGISLKKRRRRRRWRQGWQQRRQWRWWRTTIKQQSTKSGIKRKGGGSDGEGNGDATATATMKVTAGDGDGGSNNMAIVATVTAMAVMVAGF